MIRNHLSSERSLNCQYVSTRCSSRRLTGCTLVPPRWRATWAVSYSPTKLSLNCQYSLLSTPPVLTCRILLCPTGGARVRQIGNDLAGSVSGVDVPNVAFLMDDLVLQVSTHSVLTQYSLSTHPVLTQYSLSTHSVLTQYSLSTHSVLAQYSLSTYSVLYQYSSSSHSAAGQYSLSTHSILPQYSVLTQYHSIVSVLQVSTHPVDYSLSNHPVLTQYSLSTCSILTVLQVSTQSVLTQYSHNTHGAAGQYSLSSHTVLTQYSFNTQRGNTQDSLPNIHLVLVNSEPWEEKNMESVIPPWPSLRCPSQMLFSTYLLSFNVNPFPNPFPIVPLLPAGGDPVRLLGLLALGHAGALPGVAPPVRRLQDLHARRRLPGRARRRQAARRREYTHSSGTHTHTSSHTHTSQHTQTRTSHTLDCVISAHKTHT